MVKKLHPAAPELAGGKKIEEICKVLEISPARKRGAVSHLQRGLEMSQRQAWQVVVQPRATQRYVPEAEAEEERLRARLRAFSRERPRAGYRTACGQLRQEGLRVNPKRVQRLWREEGLKVPRPQRRVATRPNEVRSYDFVSDQTSDGRRLRYLCVVDEFTREGLALEVRWSFPAAAVQAWLKNQGVGPLSIAPVGAPPLLAHASAETQQP